MNQIKILWFTNTVSGAADYLGLESIIGGWIESLEKSIKKVDSINLAVAFYWGNANKIKKIDGDRAVYFVIPDNRSKLKKKIDKYTHNINTPNEIENYLEIINEFKPDIINIFGTENGFGIVSKFINIPVVIHLQGILTVYFHKWFPAGLGQLKIFRLSSFKKLLKGSSLFHDYYYFKHSAIREEKIFKSNKYFIGRTSWDKRIVNVLSSNGSYYHIDETLRDEFYKSKWVPNKDKTYKLFTTIQGNIYKGLETILETAFLLSQNNRFIWNIAGMDGTEEIVRVFEINYRKKFKDFNVNFLGKLNADKLIEEMLISDIFIHPSHIDNSPNSVCEAMLLGMPVISTNVGGISSLLTNGQEGTLIQDGDPYSLAGAILEVQKTPESFIRMGENARSRALARHDRQKIVNGLVSVYNQVLQSSGSSKKILLNAVNDPVV
jgi:glycosyltransferase involved in cell wall biosynthesis